MIRTVFSRGVLYSIGIAINRIVPEKLFRFRIFCVFDLHCPSDRHQADLSKYESESPLTYHWCQSAEEFRAAQKLTYFHTSNEIDGHRLSACLAYQGPQWSASSDPVGGVWRAVEQFDEEELGLRLLLAEDQAWICAAYVSRPHRGRGTYRRLLTNVLQSNVQSEHYASINPTNRKSIAAHNTFIRSTVGTCLAVRVFRLSICWTAGGLRSDRHLSFNSRTRPVQLRIDP